MPIHKIASVLITGILLPTALIASVQDFSFTPPERWRLQKDAKSGFETQAITRLYVSPDWQITPPSINLVAEETTLSPDQYYRESLSLLKSLPLTACQELGSVETKAGRFPFFELKSKTKYGTMRMWQMLAVIDHKAYTLTAVALDEDFPNLVPEFIEAFRSFGPHPKSD